MKSLITAYILIMLMAVTVYAVPLSEVKVSINQVTRTVNVSGSIQGAAAGKRVTLSVLKPNATFDNIDDDTYDFEASASHVAQVNTVEGGTFSFPAFTLSSDAPTGVYTLRISGDGVDSYDTTFRYSSLDEIKTAVTLIDNADMETIDGIIKANAAILGCDLKLYYNLSSDSRLLVQRALANGDFAIGGAGQQDILDAASKIIDVYMQSVCVGIVNDAKTADDVEKAINEYNSVLGLNLNGFYKDFSDNSRIAVRTLIAGLTFDSLEDLGSKFNELVCLEAVRVLPWGRISDILQALPDIDYTVFNKLNSDEKSTVFKQMAGLSFNSAGELNNKLQILSKEVLNGRSSGSGSGGGSSSGGASTSINVPVGYNGLNVASTPAPLEFDDLGSVPWAADSINALLRRGVINGKSVGKFNPDDSVTRAEFVKMLICAFNLSASGLDTAFNDVSENDWYYPYIAAAKKIGIINGVSSNTFGVNDPITRQDMATVVYRMALSQNITLPQNLQPTEFSDKNDISGYAIDAICAMQHAGILSGVGGGAFAPRLQCTRAQAAKVIYTLLKVAGRI